MRIAFAGTPEIAATVLKRLLQTELHEIVGVLTQPDRPAGRGRKLQASPVKQLAEQYNIPVLQPSSLRSPEVQGVLMQMQVDLMVVVAYGLILPGEVLQIPRLGCWNVHVSLLPRWRGAAPIQRAIEAGDAQTGVCIMQMDEGLDTGDILLCQMTDITNQDTAQTLHDRLADMGADALVEALMLQATGQLQPRMQAADGATYAKKITKAEGLIDWHQPAESIVRRIRAFNPWPVCYAPHQGEQVRIWSAECLPETAGQPGEIIAVDKHGIQVATAQGSVKVSKIQIPGGKPLAISQMWQTVSARFIPGQCWVE